MPIFCDYFNIQGCFWHSDIWLQYGVQSQAFFFVYPNSCALPFPSLNAWNSLVSYIKKKEVNRQCLSLFLCETKVTNVLNLSA